MKIKWSGKFFPQEKENVDGLSFAVNVGEKFC